MSNLIKAYWFPAVVILLMAFSWSNTSNKLDKETLAHKADIQLFKDAQNAANTKAQKDRERLETEAKTQAKQADVKYASLLANYRANLMRLKANQSAASGPHYSYVQTPEGSDGPSKGSLISITPEDADICAVNTARLQAVQEWATHATEIRKVQEDSQLEH